MIEFDHLIACKPFILDSFGFEEVGGVLVGKFGIHVLITQPISILNKRQGIGTLRQSYFISFYLKRGLSC